MKPVFGIDLTENKKNTQIDGQVFRVQAPSPALMQALENSTKKSQATVKRSQLPLALRIVQYTSGLLAACTLMGVGRADVTFEQAYENAPWVFWMGGICFAIWLVLWILGKVKSKSVLSTEESSQTFSHLESVANSIYTELGVPAEAKEVDVLSFFYKMKNGKMKLCERGMQVAPYFLANYKLFADNQTLYFVNLDGKYAFPKSEMKGIRRVKKHIRVMGWNKDTQPNEGIYKQYKLTTDQYGCVHSKTYGILKLEHNGQGYELYIPCYELPRIEKLTGLTAME